MEHLNRLEEQFITKNNIWRLFDKNQRPINRLEKQFITKNNIWRLLDKNESATDCSRCYHPIHAKQQTTVNTTSDMMYNIVQSSKVKETFLVLTKQNINKKS